MPAHIKSMLTATSVAIPVAAGRMTLGTWQAVYVIEHRAKGYRRALALHFLGTGRS
jgi:secondary thiamine-phosphate synthase enzyme